MESSRVAALAAVVKQFRENLLAQGYEHADATGVLVSSQTRAVWLTTGYGMGEFQVSLWLRPVGAGNHERTTRFRIHKLEDAQLLSAIAAILRKAATDDPAAPALGRTWTRLERLARQARDGQV